MNNQKEAPTVIEANCRNNVQNNNTTTPQVDKKQLELFVDALFRYADEGFVYLRAYLDNQKPVHQCFRYVPAGDEKRLVREAYDSAAFAANTPTAVFCPIIATFVEKKDASEKNLCLGLALSQELDKGNPPEQVKRLTQILQVKPTVLVESGGVIVDEETGELIPKLHAHWRLKEPTSTTDEHTKLKELRKLCSFILGADSTNDPIVHPIRWPGSIHQKGEPKLCSISELNSTAEIDLDEALQLVRAYVETMDTGEQIQEAIKATTEGKKNNPDKYGVRVKEILTGENFHEALRDLSAKLASAGMDQLAVIEFLQALMNESDNPRDDRWHQRYEALPNYAKSAHSKFFKEAYDQSAVNEMFDAIPNERKVEVLGSWLEPVDPFSDYSVPTFPQEVFPAAVEAYADELSAQSGFDPGAYKFALVAAFSGLLDHRKKADMKIMKQPPILWCALVSQSGGGKSPVNSAGVRFIARIDSTMQEDSHKELKKWSKKCEEAKEAKETPPPRPPYRQLIVHDTTVEALADVLQDNPEGVVLVSDELTGFIGSIDAYNGAKGGGSKDRGIYLQSFDGGKKTINRKNRATPQQVDNFSLSILAGVQPEKLGDMFMKSGGGGTSDGLFQRFLCYVMQPEKEVNYMAEMNPFTETNLAALFNRLKRWIDLAQVSDVSLAPAIFPKLQSYHNAMRTIAGRTNNARLAEHLNKFPGHVGRVALVLHCMECAEADEWREQISVDTFERALLFMRIMYRHSEAVYEQLEKEKNGAQMYVKTACEAILAKQWQHFKRGDLTRHATHWRSADDRMAENAIDLLIELNWIEDITPPNEPGKRGRRSNGAFVVNPKVHEMFSDHSERIAKQREERFEAIKEAAAGR